MDLGKVIPDWESFQKSNEFSVNRKNRQNVATDNRRTLTDKDKVRHIQTLGNDNHQSEDKRKLNCHKLRSSYVMSVEDLNVITALKCNKLPSVITFGLNPLTPASNCPRPTPNFRAFFGIFQSEQKHKNKPYVQ